MLWQIQSQGEYSHTDTTFKYIVKRFEDEDEELSEIRCSPVPPEPEEPDLDSILGPKEEKDGDSTVMAQNLSGNSRQQNEQGTRNASNFDVTVTDSAPSNDRSSDERKLPPRSPKGVDEFAFAGFSLASVVEDLFPDAKNPFRVPTSYTPWATSAKTAKATTSLASTEASSKTPSDANNDRESQLPATAETSLEGTAGLSSKAPAEIGQASTSPEVTFTSAPQEEDECAESHKNAQGSHAAATMRIEDVITPKLRLYIDDYDSKFFQKLMQDLSCQSRVCKLDIYRSWNNNGTTATSDRKRTAEDMELFFQMVQSLPNLHTLHLSNMEASTDFSYFHQSIFGHQKLQSVRIHVASGGIDETTLRTLNTLPRLNEVSLETTESFDVSLLLRSDTLRRLHIGSNGSYTFENAHLMALVPMLETNRVLWELDMEPEMSFLAFKFLAYSLRINRCLQVLRISIEPTASHSLMDQTMTEVAAVLTTNSTLRGLHNTNYRSLEGSLAVSGCRKILRALQSNTRMEHFCLFHEDSTFRKHKIEYLKTTEAVSTIYHSGGSTLKLSDESYGSYGSYSVSFLQEKQMSSVPTMSCCGTFDSISPLFEETKRFLQNAKTKGASFSSTLYAMLGRRTKSTKKGVRKSSSGSKASSTGSIRKAYSGSKASTTSSARSK